MAMSFSLPPDAAARMAMLADQVEAFNPPLVEHATVATSEEEGDE